MSKLSSKKWVGLVPLVTLFVSPLAFAEANNVANLGDIAENVTEIFPSFVKLTIALCYVLGIGFAAAAIMKFKQHKDNPQQITLGGPVAMVAISAALMFAPAVMQSAGESVFGGDVGMYGEVGSSTGYDPFDKDEKPPATGG